WVQMPYNGAAGRLRRPVMQCSGGSRGGGVMSDRDEAVESTRRRRAVIAAGSTVLALLTTACSGTPDLRPVADSLAEALVTHDFDAVPVTGASPVDIAAALSEITEGMGESSPTVAVKGIDRDADDDALRHVTLGISWE